MKSSATCQSQFKSPSCSSNAAALATPSRRNHGEVSTCSSSPLDCTPQAHSVSQMATVPRSSSPGVQRPLKRRLLMAFDNSTTPEPAGISKRRRSTGHSTSSIRSASKSPLPSPAPSTHSNQSESDSVHTSDLERQNSNRISNSECIVDGRKLTERQQLAMVLQMTANDSNSKTEDEEHHATARSSVSSSRQHRPVDESVARRIPARLNKRNERGETPLHVASIRGDAPLVAALISRGADVVSKDYAGWTPLHEACSHGHVDVVVELLEGGAPINAPGFDKERPLHDAVSNNHASTVEVLLRYGADPDLRNAKGQTALDYARFLGHNHILKLLGSEDLPAQEIPSSRAGAHAPPSSGNVESASLDSFPAADNHSSEGGLSCHSASPSGPAEKSPDSELSHKNMEPDCSPSPLLSSFNNCPQSSEVGPLHAGLGLPHSPVSSSASSTNNSSLSSSPSKCALQGTFTACSAPILESPAPHSTPKSCSPLSRFRTPCSSITSRDSGICINSSSSCFSPTTHDSSILSESVCTTPRIQVSATPPTPPSLSPIEKEKRRPFKAQKYSRARFDMLSLNDKYRDRPKVGSKHEDLPCTHTSQLVRVFCVSVMVLMFGLLSLSLCI